MTGAPCSIVHLHGDRKVRKSEENDGHIEQIAAFLSLKTQLQSLNPFPFYAIQSKLLFVTRTQDELESFAYLHLETLISLDKSPLSRVLCFCLCLKITRVTKPVSAQFIVFLYTLSKELL